MTDQGDLFAAVSGMRPGAATLALHAERARAKASRPEPLPDAGALYAEIPTLHVELPALGGAVSFLGIHARTPRKYGEWTTREGDPCGVYECARCLRPRWQRLVWADGPVWEVRRCESCAATA